jgi:PAS domain S-box-containing protein
MTSEKNRTSPDPVPELPKHSLHASRPWLQLKDVMVREVLTISPEATAVEAAQRMAEKNVSCILVSDPKGSICGIVSERDMLKKVVSQDLASVPKVAGIMTSPVISAGPALSILEASRMMESKNIKRLPVIQDGNLLGIVTLTDLTQALASYGMWRNISEIMTDNVAAIPRGTSVVEAARIMAERNISCILVSQGADPSGIITERDLFKKVVASQKDARKMSVDEVMSAKLICVPPDCSIYNATRIIEEKRIRHLVVMDEKKLLGIVTQTDIFLAVRKKLEEEERVNRHWLENATHGVFTMDLNGVVTFANKAFLKLLEVEDPWKIINHPFLPETFWPGRNDRTRFFEELADRGGVEIREMSLRTARAREIYVTLFTTFTKDAHGEVDGYQGMLYDVTDKKELGLLRKAEEALRERNEVLQRLNEIESEFVSMVSHELKNPLMIASESIQMIQEELLGPLTEKQRKFLRISKDAIDRLIRLIKDLLDISKIEAGKMDLQKQEIDLAELAQKTLAPYKEFAAPRGIDLKVEALCENTTLHADRDRIAQVLKNLIDNAVKFTETGSVTIRLRRSEREIECCVEDTGAGIAEENLPRVFQKFQQFTDAFLVQKKGTGLSLSIAKAIVELHGGRVWFESEFGKGSRFFFSLPV